MTAPLSHVRVLDLSRVLAGPWATQTLADLGAEVVKVERPGAGDDTRKWGPPFLPGPNGEPTAETACFLSANRDALDEALNEALSARTAAAWRAAPGVGDQGRTGLVFRRPGARPRPDRRRARAQSRGNPAIHFHDRARTGWRTGSGQVVQCLWHERPGRRSGSARARACRADRVHLPLFLVARDAEARRKARGRAQGRTRPAALRVGQPFVGQAVSACGAGRVCDRAHARHFLARFRFRFSRARLFSARRLLDGRMNTE